MKILVLAGHAGSVVNFRGPLLRAMQDAGHEVHAAAPALTADSGAAGLARAGVGLHDIALQRTGMNPLADLGGMLDMLRLMRRLRPDLVLGYTIKPVVFGTLAAWVARVPRRFALITGLGYAFTGVARGRRRLVQGLARGLYRVALSRAQGVVFQNPDDAALFVRLGLVAGEKVTVVDGSGVDTGHYARAPVPDVPAFLLVARLLGDKGVREYAAAARQVRRRYPDAVFHLVGGLDSNPDAIPRPEVEGWHAARDIHWHGTLKDVRPMLAATAVFVLPSYREGTPRSVLEAMATGRAVITTDAPGCRETVREGENGFLVPVGDARALAAAMERFLEDPALARRMGAASHALALARYDVDKVNAAMLAATGLARACGAETRRSARPEIPAPDG